MSRDTIMTDADGEQYSFDGLATQKWLEGHKPGLEAGAAYLKEQATDLFRSGHHNQAIAMQELAKQMLGAVGPLLDKQVADHKRDHPYKVTQ